MQKFIVPEQPVRAVRSKDGRQTFQVQTVGLVGADGLASRFEIWHYDDAKPYAPGQYVLDVDRSIYVDRKGNLAIRPVLISLGESKVKAA